MWFCSHFQTGPVKQTDTDCHPPSCFQATFKGWMDIMYAAVDSRDVSLHSCAFPSVCPVAATLCDEM